MIARTISQCIKNAPVRLSTVQQFTYISGFAIKGLLRCCLQSPNEEHWVGLSIPTEQTHTHLTG